MGTFVCLFAIKKKLKRMFRVPNKCLNEVSAAFHSQKYLKTKPTSSWGLLEGVAVLLVCLHSPSGSNITKHRHSAAKHPDLRVLRADRCAQL